MNWILSPEEIDSEDRHRVGGKGYALSLLVKGGFPGPFALPVICIRSFYSGPACVSLFYWNFIVKILKHVRLVWSSLWSDAALLYRQEIGWDVEKSSMAAVVQETVASDRSGAWCVVFHSKSQ